MGRAQQNGRYACLLLRLPGDLLEPALEQADAKALRFILATGGSAAMTQRSPLPSSQ
jgi:hypothetical protein